jgi:hypothetical protein
MSLPALSQLRANDQRCHCGDLALNLKMLSCSSSRVGGVAVLADEALGTNSMHGVPEAPFHLDRPWSFWNAQKIMHALKAAEKIRATQFEGLIA